jgi:hypothetical protein
MNGCRLVARIYRIALPHFRRLTRAVTTKWFTSMRALRAPHQSVGCGFLFAAAAFF